MRRFISALAATVILSSAGSGIAAEAANAAPAKAGKITLEFKETILCKTGSDFEPEALVVSPDGRRVAYRSCSFGEKAGCVVVDGVKGKTYEQVFAGSVAFSPDGKRVAYYAVKDGKCVLVVDGVEGEPYDQMVKGCPSFSPDSKHVAYGAMIGKKSFVVVDGVQRQGLRVYRKSHLRSRLEDGGLRGALGRKMVRCHRQHRR